MICLCFIFIIQISLEGMHPNDRKKLDHAISLLQELSDQKSSSSGVSKIMIPGFDQEVGVFTKIGEQLEP